MSDEDRNDLLYGLFSGDSAEEPEENLEAGPALELSTSSLFSSHDEGNEQNLEVRAPGPTEPPKPVPASPVAQATAQQKSREDAAGEETLAPRVRRVAERVSVYGAASPAPTTDRAFVGGAEGSGTGEPLTPLRTGSERAFLGLEAAPIDRDLREEQQRLLKSLLGGAALVGLAGLAAVLLGSLQRRGGWLAFALSLAGGLLAAAAFMLRHIPSRWRAVVLIATSYALALSSMIGGSVWGTGPWVLLAIPVLLLAFAGERWGLVSGIADLLIYGAFVAAQQLGWLAEQQGIATRRGVSHPLISIVSFGLVLAALVVLYSLSARVQRRLRWAFGQQGGALRAAQALSAQRQQELGRVNLVLRRQARYQELATEVGRLTTMGLNLDVMMARAVALIQQKVDADYVGLFLLDEDRIYAELRAQAGALPAPSLGLRAIVRITDDVLLRQCVSSGRPRTILGLGQARELTGGGVGSPFLHRATRSALALPLIARGKVFGALSVQSQSPVAFSGDEVASLRNVADQVSSGISNAQLAEQLGACLAQMQTLQQYYVRESWDQFLMENAASVYEYHRPEVAPLEGGPLPEAKYALAPADVTASGPSDASTPLALLVPIALREQTLGVLGLHRVDEDEPWTEEQIELLTAVSEQMGLVIENSRLFAEARSRAARERQAREIVSRLRQSLDTEEILATAVQEMGEALQLKDVTIRLTGTEGQPGE